MDTIKYVSKPEFVDVVLVSTATVEELCDFIDGTLEHVHVSGTIYLVVPDADIKVESVSESHVIVQAMVGAALLPVHYLVKKADGQVIPYYEEDLLAKYEVAPS